MELKQYNESQVMQNKVAQSNNLLAEELARKNKTQEFIRNSNEKTIKSMMGLADQLNENSYYKRAEAASSKKDSDYVSGFKVVAGMEHESIQRRDAIGKQNEDILKSINSYEGPKEDRDEYIKKVVTDAGYKDEKDFQTKYVEFNSVDNVKRDKASKIAAKNMDERDKSYLKNLNEYTLEKNVTSIMGSKFLTPKQKISYINKIVDVESTNGKMTEEQRRKVKKEEVKYAFETYVIAKDGKRQAMNINFWNKLARGEKGGMSTFGLNDEDGEVAIEVMNEEVKFKNLNKNVEELNVQENVKLETFADTKSNDTGMNFTLNDADIKGYVTQLSKTIGNKFNKLDVGSLTSEESCQLIVTENMNTTGMISSSGRSKIGISLKNGNKNEATAICITEIAPRNDKGEIDLENIPYYRRKLMDKILTDNGCYSLTYINASKNNSTISNNAKLLHGSLGESNRLFKTGSKNYDTANNFYLKNLPREKVTFLNNAKNKLRMEGNSKKIEEMEEIGNQAVVSVVAKHLPFKKGFFESIGDFFTGDDEPANTNDLVKLARTNPKAFEKLIDSKDGLREEVVEAYVSTQETYMKEDGTNSVMVNNRPVMLNGTDYTPKELEKKASEGLSMIFSIGGKTNFSKNDKNVEIHISEDGLTYFLTKNGEICRRSNGNPTFPIDKESKKSLDRERKINQFYTKKSTEETGNLKKDTKETVVSKNNVFLKKDLEGSFSIEIGIDYTPTVDPITGEVEKVEQTMEEKVKTQQKVPGRA